MNAMAKRDPLRSTPVSRQVRNSTPCPLAQSSRDGCAAGRLGGTSDFWKSVSSGSTLDCVTRDIVSGKGYTFACVLSIPCDLLDYTMLSSR